MPVIERKRWWFYTVNPEDGAGTAGPWGPVEAHDEDEARRIADARAKAHGLVVQRIERVDAR